MIAAKLGEHHTPINPFVSPISMPAQKRTLVESLNDEDTSTQLHYHRHAKQSRRDGQVRDAEKEQQNLQQQDVDGVGEGEGATVSGEGQEEHDEEKDDVDDGGQGGADGEEEEEDNSEGGPSSATEDKLEFIYVELSEIRKDVQCPICLGIIKKTRTVMECLHRFCRECIDKSMRLGNNECPACRTHCASRRSLRDDPNYDAIIAALYPDIEKYEEEELTFLEEEKARNKQIQASIAKIVQRQSEALGKKRPLGKDVLSTFSPRLRNNRNTHLRRRNHTIDLHGSEENGDENDNIVETDSSSADERSATLRQRRRKRWTRTRNSHPSSSMASPDGGTAENADISKENRGISPGLVSNPEMLAWGPRGARSHTRHGGACGGNNKSSRSTRLLKFVEHLRSLDENKNELDVHLMLVSLEKESAPSLMQPYLCCRPTLSIKHLCEYVARQTPWPAEEVEMLSLKGCFLELAAGSDSDRKDNLDLTTLVVDPSKAEVKILEGHETLSTVRTSCISIREHMIIAYRRKVTS